MKNSKLSDYQAMNTEDLEKELLALRREQFNLRMQKSTGQFAAPHRLRQVRRNIARIKTLQGQKMQEGVQS